MLGAWYASRDMATVGWVSSCSFLYSFGLELGLAGRGNEIQRCGRLKVSTISHPFATTRRFSGAKYQL